MDKTTFQYTPASGTYQSPATYPMTEVDERALPDSRDKSGMPSSVITIASYSPQPQDHVLWSVFNTLYMNFCCLGFLALVFSVKARDRKVLGDMNGAFSYGSTSKYLNIAALVLSILFIILIIILTATGLIRFASNLHEDDYPWGHRNGK